MFTGIVETLAPIVPDSEAPLLTIQRPEIFTDIHLGQSISVSGACLSVIEFSEKFITFDVVPETLARTNLEAAAYANLERAMPVDGRFEGHVVSGHIDTTIKLLEQKKEKTGEWWTFELPEKYAHLVVEKGSITLNGISLTVAAVSDATFSVALIPHTLNHTNLCLLKLGESVNMETDLMAKYWWKWQHSQKSIKS